MAVADRDDSTIPAIDIERRIPSLDVLRGIAIIGTLSANIWLFQSFFGRPVIDPAWRGAISGLPGGKFLGLLTIMFGIGLAIQRESARKHGRRWPGTYLLRAGLLFIDGCLNYIFVVQFDVLRCYAFIAFVVAFVLLLMDKWQWVFIGIALSVHLGLLVAGAVWPDAITAAGSATSLAIPGAPEYGGGFDYGNSVAVSAYDVFDFLSIGTDSGTIVTMGFVMFPLGAMLYRRGVFEARGAHLRRWLMVIGLGVGLPIDLVIRLTGIVDGSWSRFVTAPLVAFGILGLVAGFYQRRRVGVVGRRIGAVGRMALSCYVLQNVLGRVAQQVIGHSPLARTLDTTVGTVLLFGVIALLLVCFASSWLRFFRKGPLELVWDWSFRRLTRPRVRS